MNQMVLILPLPLTFSTPWMIVRTFRFSDCFCFKYFPHCAGSYASRLCNRGLIQISFRENVSVVSLTVEEVLALMNTGIVASNK